MGLVIDLRCLQDRNYYERGIGSHARCLLRHAPEFVGLVDPTLPPLPPEAAALAPNLSPHADVKGARMLLNPSPFTPGQEFLARLLTNPAVLKAVCVHDFIPFDDQENYLTHPINRLEYFTAMAWLRRYNVFLPNSVPTQARLHQLYGPVQSHVTGVALPPWALGIAPQKPRHILMVGGDDARKNPELLAAAHALLRRPLPLVITGYVAPALAEKLQAITEIELPGRLSNAEMRDMYAQAVLVVTPSRAEGFSLPVLEACAAGIPSIASDIPAHRALLPPEFLFPLDNPAACAALIEQMLGQRGAVAAAQAGLWQGFTEQAVAARVFAPLLPKPAVARRVRPKLALLSTLPPAPSGIADYSAAMLRELDKLADISVFSARQSPLPYMDARFDAVLSVIGNAPVHERVHDFCLRWGGAVLCHDSRLMGLFSRRGTAALARQAAEELGRAVDEAEILSWAANERLREASFLGPIARAARPLIFHEPHSVALVQARFGVEAKYLPFALQREFAPVPRANARAALGIERDAKLIVSFGFLTPGKGLDAALAALARLPGWRMVCVGEATAHVQILQVLADDLGASPRVTLGTGYVNEQTYRLWLAAATVGLQLRAGQPGAISGTLQDCIGAGLPCVANADLAENLQAPAYVQRVADALDADEIAAAIEKAAGQRRNKAQCATYRAAHSMADYAQALLRMLEL